MRVLMKSFFLPLRLLRRLSRTLRSGKSRTVWGAAVYGWAVSASLLMLTGAFCLVAVGGGPQAPEIIMALAEATPLWCFRHCSGSERNGKTGFVRKRKKENKITKIFERKITMGGFKPSRKLLILQAMEQDRKRKEELERKHRGYDSLVKTSYTGIKEDENEAKPETGRKKLLGE